MRNLRIKISKELKAMFFCQHWPKPQTKIIKRGRKTAIVIAKITGINGSKTALV